MNEIWKDISGYEGHYQASSMGNVRVIKDNKIINLNQKCKNFKYKIIKLSRDGVSKTFYVHALIARTFLNNPSYCPTCGTKFEINHINNATHDNSAKNLEYVTHIQNVKHSSEKTRKANKNIKLSDEKVKDIKKLIDEGCFYSIIAKKYNVSKSTISDISNGRLWKHIEI